MKQKQLVRSSYFHSKCCPPACVNVTHCSVTLAPFPTHSSAICGFVYFRFVLGLFLVDSFFIAEASDDERPEKKTSKHEIPKQHKASDKRNQKYLGWPFDDVDGGEMCGMPQRLLKRCDERGGEMCSERDLIAATCDRR